MRPVQPFLACALALFALPACPDDADDDSTPTPSDDGQAPVLESVDLCEVPGTRDACADAGYPDAIDVRFDVALSDTDCDLNNPIYLVGFVDFPPLVDGFIEQDLGCGGSVSITLSSCIGVGRLDQPYRIKFRDADQNESEPVDGTWINPGDTHNDDCEPLP